MAPVEIVDVFPLVTWWIFPPSNISHYPYGNYMETIWKLYGNYMDTVDKPYEKRIFHILSTSFLPKTRPITTGPLWGDDLAEAHQQRQFGLGAVRRISVSNWRMVRMIEDIYV